MIRLISCADGCAWKGGWIKLGVSRTPALTIWLQAQRLTFLTRNQQLSVNMTLILALYLSISVYCNEIHATTAARVVTIGKERKGNARSYDLNHNSLWPKLDWHWQNSD